jgi:DNA-binding transcriptional ArsR family regulator
VIDLGENEVSRGIAELASIFSDPTRVGIVMLLMQENEGLSTLDICTRLDLPQPRVSSHLSLLLSHGAVSVSKRGRQRIYSLSSDRVAYVLEDLVTLFAPKKRTALVAANSARYPEAYSEIRQCRTCYDHLAGVAGVELLQQMLSAGWLAEESKKGTKPTYRLTRLGTKSLSDRGVDLESALKSSRIFAYGCLDWTENQPHLGGSLGNAVLNSIFSRGFVQRKTGTRALKILKPFSSWIGESSYPEQHAAAT